MTVDELIARLQGCDPDAGVRIAIQPSWPLQFHTAGVAEHDNGRGDTIAYIVQADDHPDDGPYAPDGVFADAST